MKLLLFLILLSGFINAQSTYNIQDILAKKGRFRVHNSMTFLKKASLISQEFSLMETIDIDYGILSNFQVSIALDSYYIWERIISNNTFETQSDYRFRSFNLGLSRHYKPHDHPYGFIVSGKLPLYSSDYFNDNNTLVKENNSIHYLSYTMSFYNVISPLIPTIQFRYKHFLSSRYTEKHYTPGNEASLGLNINFSVNDTITLLWGSSIKNIKPVSLRGNMIDGEKNQIYFLYGFIYDVNKTYTFQVLSSFVLDSENISLISFQTTQKI